ncbi:hypothetical protein [Bremerella sp.]|uniref:hypothetical protein n=1 Tax=Bremerella sp. TaxID=2795602 RepID=UPI003919280F
MNTIRDFFIDYLARAEANSELRNLRVVRAEWEAFLKTHPTDRGHMQDGPIPFGMFSYWVAIQAGESNKRPDGRWTRNEASFWRIIEEKLGNDQAGFEALIDLLDGYSTISICLKYRFRFSAADSREDIESVEAWEMDARPGCFLTIVFRSGRQQFQGFYSSLSELLLAADTRFKIEEHQWEKL